MSRKKRKKRRKCCIFVASGPTAREADAFRHYGPLTTMNWAIHLFEQVDIAFFGSSKKMRSSKESWDHARKLITLFPKIKGEWAGMPMDRTEEFIIPEPPREPGKMFKYIAIHIKEGNVLGRATKALHYLRKVEGYTDVWLFGHDGGHDYHPDLHQEPVKRHHNKDRFVVEETCKYLGLNYTFWPNRPEGF